MLRHHLFTRQATLLAAVAIAGLGACTRFHHGEIADLGPGYVIFNNESLDQADVYAVGPGGGSVRIGTVMAGRTDTLTVPAEMTAPRVSATIVARMRMRSLVAGTGLVAIYPGALYLVRLPQDEKLLSFVPGQ